jgi:gliding motility-associated-like protein
MSRIVIFFLCFVCFAFAHPLAAQSVWPGNQPATSCVDTAFTKVYFPPSRVITIDCAGKIGGNQILIGGGANSLDPTSFGKAYMARLDQQGNFISSQAIDSAQATTSTFLGVIFRQQSLPDQGVFLIGACRISTSSIRIYTFIQRLNAAGQILWTQRYYSPYWNEVNDPVHPSWLPWENIAFDASSGDLFVTGTERGLGLYVCRISGSDGRVIWSKAFEGAFSEYAAGIDVKDTVVHLINLGPKIDYSDFSHFQLHKNTGALLGLSQFIVDSPIYQKWMIRSARAFQKLANGHYLIGGLPYGLSLPIFPTAYSLVELDEQFHFVQAYTIRSTNTYGGYASTFHQLPNGYTVIAIEGNNNTQFLPWYFMFVKDGQLTKQCKTNNLTHKYERFNFLSFSDSAFYCFGKREENFNPTTTAGADYSLEISRISTADTALGCLGKNINLFSIHPFTLVEQPLQPDPFMVIRDTIYRELGFYPIDTFNFAMLRTNVCSSLAVCDSFGIRADVPVVCLNQPLTLRVHKNRLCGSPVTWQYDPAVVSSFSRVDDSTYRFQFASSFSGYLYATMDACEIKRDSVFIRALPPMPAVNLGSDAFICGNQSFVLHGQPGYATYQWQDGSSDSTFTVTQPGQYYLTVTDACGSTSSDTVLVTPYQPPTNISLGADRSKCNQDTIQLLAPAGYIGYNWTPAYQLTQLQPNAVTVNPSRDTCYVVRVEYVTGCFAYDTVCIRVYQSPPVQLGADTSFCSGQSVTLNAGTGFVQYQWSNGLSSQQISVNAIGQYSVQATTVNRCVSADTFQVLNVYPLPVVRLDDRDWICSGQPRTLQAGNFQSYVWQDLSTASSYTVNHPGTYHVTVTDEHRCVGSDTVFIRRIEPLPAGFLPEIVEKCSYETITLQPSQPYDQYQWSTQSQQSSILISDPGQYWLQVTDRNDCIGFDTTMVISKNCFRGVYIPSAFSPNGDGRNDQLRATIYGNCDWFELKVFDRYGRCVFVSNQPAVSWDGSDRNKPVEAGTYVWMLRYRLTGQIEVSEKGTVTLIR